MQLNLLEYIKNTVIRFPDRTAATAPGVELTFEDIVVKSFILSNKMRSTMVVK